MIDFTPYYRHSPRAKEQLAKTLGLFWDKNTQDWDLINANPSSIGGFLKAYQQLKDADEKFVLMELILASFDDFQSAKDFDDTLWKSCTMILVKEHALHIFSIYYWSTAANQEHPFFLSAYMDAVLDQVRYHYF